MRASLLLPAFACATLIATSSIGCGSPKPPPVDPSAEGAGKTDDTPKWEGATNPTGPSHAAGSSGSSASPDEPKSKPGPGVQEGATRRSDQYDKEATDVVLKRAARQVKENCGAAKDDTGKATGPWGKATIQVQLGHNGRSKGLTVPAPYQGKVTGNCIEKAFANLTYPPWGGSDAQVDWEVEVVQPAAEGGKK